MDRRLRIDLPIILLLAKKDYVTKLKKTVIKELIFNYRAIHEKGIFRSSRRI